MTYVVNESCIKCKYMDCVEVCPVDCFYEGENMLVIHPDECIDCGVCEPECPVDAIKPDTETGLEKWLGINAEYARVWPNITVKREPPPDATLQFPRQGLQLLMNFGALSRGFSTCCLRFKNRVATTRARLASGWLARLYREGVEPSGSLQKVSDHISRPPFLDLSWRKGRFILNPPSLAVLFDHLVGAGEERRRTSELFPPPLSSVPCLPLHAAVLDISAARYHDPSAPGGNGSFRLAARRQRQRKISHCQ